ncbi:PPE family protein [Mycobacterium marinum]|uniref:PPE family protein n=1 Tax=Mycobacterium marinum TaxID=1781 RepID=UPI0021C3DC87|nr:PPE family protein [Mycobacterium marinum]GJO08252.1 PPE family protein [Mycobacterium marinum]GJO15132.1 PPE family protein [Mycobacterium marinum]GJO21265.1 PPE family protein [Mycobacterium marinum]GJO21407.1 PPE family protein [Mycobacterium marinum]GJO40228.1 PPE family protein [Mycobacterium marinum]
MSDFGALPPEINSARMYSGPGSGPLLAAASAWDAVAAQLELYASGTSSVLAELLGQTWSGATALMVAAAVMPHVAWATTMAAQAEQTASQARGAAAAFEIAFTATVPPPIVAANRIQLATLIATNFFGQNTPAIAATEAAYAEMWAQDAAAMYGYAASCSAATILTPFGRPPRITSDSGQSGQATAVAQASDLVPGQARAALISAVPQQLQALASGYSANATNTTSATAASPTSVSSVVSPLASAPLTALDNVNTLTGPANLAAAFSRSTTSAMSAGTGLYRTDLQTGPTGVRPGTAGLRPVGAANLGGTVLAKFGEAVPVGKLSVPQSWATASPIADPTNTPLARPEINPQAATITADNPGANILGAAPTAGSQSRMGSVVLRNGRRAFRMPRPAFGG